MYRDPFVNIAHFDSITELAAYANEHVPEESSRRSNADPKFFGHTTFAQAVARCAMGYDACVPEAQRMLALLENSVSVTTSAFESSVSGAFPMVPEYLSGEPECMADVVQCGSDVAPLSIFVDMTSSGSIPARDFRKRGVAVLALTMMMSQVRPVSLHLFCCGGADERTKKMRDEGEHYSIVTARIETAPLDLARAAFALSDVAVPRRLFYGVQRHLHDFNGCWPSLRGTEHGATTSPEYIGRLKTLLNADGETLLIPALSNYSQETKMMIEEPVEWLNGKLAELAGVVPA